MTTVAANPETCEHEFDWLDAPVCIHCNLPASALPPVASPEEQRELAEDEGYSLWLIERTGEQAEREAELAWFAGHVTPKCEAA